MNKPTIAVDLDDVLAASAQQYIDYTNKRWGTNLTLEDYNENLTTMWKMEQHEVLKHATELFKSGFIRDFPHLDEAKPVLNKLKKKFRLVITTSRIRLVYKDTLEWLDQHHPGVFEEIYLAGVYDDGSSISHTRTKKDLYKDIKPDYVIDDQPKHCLAAAKLGINTLLYGTYSWNRNAKLPNNVTRVRDWHEVAEYFGV
jgi:5'(3')-deoxyribonucleotidase